MRTAVADGCGGGTETRGRGACTRRIRIEYFIKHYKFEIFLRVCDIHTFANRKILLCETFVGKSSNL